MTTSLTMGWYVPGIKGERWNGNKERGWKKPVFQWILPSAHLSKKISSSPNWEARAKTKSLIATLTDLKSEVGRGQKEQRNILTHCVTEWQTYRVWTEKGRLLKEKNVDMFSTHWGPETNYLSNPTWKARAVEGRNICSQRTKKLQTPKPSQFVKKWQSVITLDYKSTEIRVQTAKSGK